MPPDTEFLDALFERALLELEEGRTVSVVEWIAGREHLRERAEELVRRARRVAVIRPPAEPIRIPGYEVLDLLGHGGMGAVYLARQKRVGGRLVALKILPAGVALSPRARERFRSEANLVAKLRHPNVIAVYDVVDEASVQAYAMERVDGPSLAQLIEWIRAEPSRPALDVVRERLDATAIPDRTYAIFVCRIGIAIARALGAVHRAGLLHRDVKPSNILLRRDGTPLLSDFGLVRETDSGSETRSGHFVGTPAFASPEQLRGETSSLTPLADVYALGVALYHALALDLPFRGRGTAELLCEIETGRGVPLRKKDPRLSVDLETIVAKAMDAEPARRYASADAFGDDLERLLGLQPIEARRAGLATRVAKLVRRNRRAVVAATAGALAALLLSVAFVVWWFLVPRWVDGHVREARLALLDPGQGTGIFDVQALGWRGPESASRPLPEAFDAALACYAAAIRLSPGDADVRLESATVELALRLTSGDSLPEPSALLDRAAPLTVAVAEAWPGTEILDESRLRAAAMADLRALGLLLFLTGRVDESVEVWSRLDLWVDPDPFIEAALGQTYLFRDEPARAYPRLRRAVESFPNVGFLTVSLADAALRCGDVSKARRHLEAATHMGRLDPFQGLDRVEGDLFVALGDDDAARGRYAVAEDANALARFRQAQLLERRGESRAAFRRYLEVARVWPTERVDRALIDAAERWWSALGPAERFGWVRRSLDEPEDAPDGCLALLRGYREARVRRADPGFRNGAAPEESDPSPFLQRTSLWALTERMEEVTMSNWTRWRTYPTLLKDLLAGAWLSPGSAPAASLVDPLWRSWRLVAAVVASLALPAASASAQGSFQGLGDLPGGTFQSIANGLSADATTVVGYSESANGTEAFRWRAETGMIGLGDLPGGVFASNGYRMSADGSVVLGNGNSAASAPNPEVFRWTEASGMVGIGDLPGSIFQSGAGAMTADGSTVFGGSYSGRGYVAFRWTAATGMVDLGFPDFNSVNAGNPDGSVLAGWHKLGDDYQLFRWSASDGFVPLGDFPGGTGWPEPTDMSDDGSVMVGWGTNGVVREAFRWTEATGLVALDDLPGGTTESLGLCILPDGSLMGGYGHSASGREGTIWHPDASVERAADFLAANGVDIPSGWTLTAVWGLTETECAVTMAGDGFNPLGNAEAWIASYPTPAAIALRSGNVDTGDGSEPFDVMFLNDSVGDPVERKVTVTAGVPATLRIAKAPSTPNLHRGGYGFWIYEGDLRGCEDILIKKASGAIVALGKANGCMPVNNTVTPGSCPCPLEFPLGKTAATLSVPKSALLCLEPMAAPKSPTEFMVTFPAGTFTILSVHLDLNAPASPAKNASIGNTIVVVAE